MSYYYTSVGQARVPGRITTSTKELLQIAAAAAVLTADITLLLSEHTFLVGYQASGLLAAFTLNAVLLAAAAVFTGFIAHEMAHKIVAQRLGFWAEFRMWPIGLVLSLVTAVAGFLWAMPGATMVGGISPSDRESWGRTGLAGPLTNVAFGAVFLGTALSGLPLGAAAVYWLLYLATINGWFGTFNLIPFGPLDGRKVLSWSAVTWAGSIAFTATIFVLSILGFLSIQTFHNAYHCYTAFGSCF